MGIPAPTDNERYFKSEYKSRLAVVGTQRTRGIMSLVDSGGHSEDTRYHELGRQWWALRGHEVS